MRPPNLRVKAVEGNRVEVGLEPRLEAIFVWVGWGLDPVDADSTLLFESHQREVEAGNGGWGGRCGMGSGA